MKNAIAAKAQVNDEGLLKAVIAFKAVDSKQEEEDVLELPALEIADEQGWDVVEKFLNQYEALSATQIALTMRAALEDYEKRRVLQIIDLMIDLIVGDSDV